MKERKYNECRKRKKMDGYCRDRFLVIYYTGNLAEDRCYDKDVADIPKAFAKYAEEKRVEFFQKRKTKVDRSQTPKRPILDYIVRKIK